MRVHSLQHPDLPPFEMPARFRTEVAFFMTPTGEPGVPELGPGEYWIRLEDARRWLDEGVLYIVSPLDAASKAEIELSEEQEAWLEWMLDHSIEHVRLEATSRT